MSANFFCDDNTRLGLHTPSNSNSITLYAGRHDYDHITLFGLPQSIVDAFLAHYGNPNDVATSPTPVPAAGADVDPHDDRSGGDLVTVETV